MVLCESETAGWASGLRSRGLSTWLPVDQPAHHWPVHPRRHLLAPDQARQGRYRQQAQKGRLCWIAADARVGRAGLVAFVLVSGDPVGVVETTAKSCSSGEARSMPGTRPAFSHRSSSVSLYSSFSCSLSGSWCRCLSCRVSHGVHGDSTKLLICSANSAHLQEFDGGWCYAGDIFQRHRLLRQSILRALSFPGSAEAIADLLIAQLPQFFQVVWGASAIRSGVLLLPLILVQTATSMSAGLITSKTGDYRVSRGVIRRRRRHVFILCALTVEPYPRLRTLDRRARLAVDAHAVKLVGSSRRIPSLERRRCRTDIPDLARCHSGVTAPQGYGRRNVSARHERKHGRSD